MYKGRSDNWLAEVEDQVNVCGMIGGKARMKAEKQSVPKFLLFLHLTTSFFHMSSFFSSHSYPWLHALLWINLSNQCQNLTFTFAALRKPWKWGVGGGSRQCLWVDKEEDWIVIHTVGSVTSGIHYKMKTQGITTTLSKHEAFLWMKGVRAIEQVTPL